jgi:hypothetical protein
LALAADEASSFLGTGALAGQLALVDNETWI